MLPRLLDETLAVIGTQAGAIWLYDPDDCELRRGFARDWLALTDQSPLKPGEGIGGKVFSTGEIYISREFARDPQRRMSTQVPVPLGWGGACIPIRTAEEIVGVFYVSVRLPRQLKPEEIHLLTTLCEISGNAIHRMRLYAQTELHAERLSALHAIDMAITTSLDLRLPLNVLLLQVINQLDVDAVDIMLLNERAQVLEYTAGIGFNTSAELHPSLRLGEGYAGRAALEHKIVTMPEPGGVTGDLAQALLITKEGFKAYYGVPLVARGRIKGVMEIYHRAPLKPDAEWLNFLETLAGQAAIAIEFTQLFDHLQRSNADLMVAYDSTIEGWSRALELRDQETEGHTRRVTEMTLKLAHALNAFNEEELVHVRRGALLHDIGKMAIPDEILFKPSALSPEEWEKMRRHPGYAVDMLASIAYLRPVLDIPYCHHEKWDGTGYPHGLKGEQIPFGARIFAVADVWDALTSDRPYRPAWSPEKARAYIAEQSAVHFDPQVVEVFLKLLDSGSLQEGL
jgi:putative nucleotidyltransferase with HDIG domain